MKRGQKYYNKKAKQRKIIQKYEIIKIKNKK